MRLLFLSLFEEEWFSRFVFFLFEELGFISHDVEESPSHS